MLNILTLSNSRLLTYHLVALDSSMLGGLVIVLLTGCKHADPRLIILCHPRSCVAIRIIRHSLLAEKYCNLGSGPLPSFFILQCGQKAVPLFVGNLNIFLIFFLHFILHKCW